MLVGKGTRTEIETKGRILGTGKKNRGRNNREELLGQEQERENWENSSIKKRNTQREEKTEGETGTIRRHL